MRDLHRNALGLERPGSLNAEPDADYDYPGRRFRPGNWTSKHLKGFFGFGADEVTGGLRLPEGRQLLQRLGLLPGGAREINVPQRRSQLARKRTGRDLADLVLERVAAERLKNKKPHQLLEEDPLLASAIDGLLSERLADGDAGEEEAFDPRSFTHFNLG